MSPFGITLRIHDAALDREESRNQFIHEKFLPFLAMYGTVRKLVVGHHTNTDKPHYHIHATLDEAGRSPICSTKQAFNTPLAWWRSQCPKHKAAGMPLAPIGVKPEVSVKYKATLDDPEGQRLLQYPLKEVSPSTLEEEASDLFPLASGIDMPEWRELACLAHGEYTVQLQANRRKAELEEKRSATQDKLYAHLDASKARGFRPLCVELVKHYLEEHDDVPIPQTAQRHVLLYMLKRGYMSAHQYADLAVPRGLSERLLEGAPAPETIVKDTYRDCQQLLQSGDTRAVIARMREMHADLPPSG